ncbi:MAG: hypothetical protein HKN99_12270 [Winogradskyella sp.]|nr:hypothetical protein [Winogradskyella sp.]NNC46650.1 hypothetical protein [Winogradskyella sp.]
MAPTKFEDQMRNTLEKRTIAPSPEAWSKLEYRLNDNNTKKGSKLYWWIGIAASVLIIITISINSFSSSEKEVELPLVIEAEPEVLEELNKKTPVQNNKAVEVVSKNPSQQRPVDQETAREKVNNEQLKTPMNQSVVQNTTKSTVESNKNTILESTLSLIKDKVSELTVKVDIEDTASIIEEIKNKSAVPTDKEIDSLLKAAQKELLIDKTFKESNRTVNANSLLRDVEDELEQSFRSKVLEALVSGYETVKTAVANRNN